MKIGNKHYRSIWVNPSNPLEIQIIDQRYLPHEFIIRDLKHPDDFVHAIKDMLVRGAPLIGITAAYGLYSALLHSPAHDADANLQKAYDKLLATRPTGNNLRWALSRQLHAINEGKNLGEKIKIALENANRLADEDVKICRQIGKHGLPLIAELSKKKNGAPVNILTHCNAGWLATVDYGTATAPIYLAHDAGISVHVWVDETRPRNQGASLTAFELGKHGVPHTVVVDNAGGHLMQRGRVDMCIVGTDRTLASGDVCNKIGTYLKALAAFDNKIPFYVALPSSSIDWETKDASQIPIEERSESEVKHVQGFDGKKIVSVLVTPSHSKVSNFGFDITPARLITGLITERGICKPDRKELSLMFYE
ncbi:MAG TPA: S-methyl-5-thioribose-1-phosphate isomerase [Chitinophagales bacterium]|nr:S-methyl-5-thioribose-1-phosphate isomerase [Chitinophagales bacterium]